MEGSSSVGRSVEAVASGLSSDRPSVSLFITFLSLSSSRAGIAASIWMELVLLGMFGRVWVINDA